MNLYGYDGKEFIELREIGTANTGAVIYGTGIQIGFFTKVNDQLYKLEEEFVASDYCSSYESPAALSGYGELYGVTKKDALLYYIQKKKDELVNKKKSLEQQIKIREDNIQKLKAELEKQEIEIKNYMYHYSYQEMIYKIIEKKGGDYLLECTNCIHSGDACRVLVTPYKENIYKVKEVYAHGWHKEWHIYDEQLYFISKQAFKEYIINRYFIPKNEEHIKEYLQEIAELNNMIKEINKKIRSVKNDKIL